MTTQKIHAQTYGRCTYTTILDEKYCMNIGLVKHGIWGMASWSLKKMLKLSILSFQTGVAEGRLLGNYFHPPCLIGPVYHDFLRNLYPQLLQIWVCRLLRFIFGSCVMGAPPHFLLAVREFLNNVFPAQQIRGGEPTGWPARSPDLKSYDFYIWGHLSLFLILQRSVTWDWYDLYDTWNSQLSQPVTVQTCNLLRWSWRWTLQASSLIIRWTWLVNHAPTFIKHIFLYWGVDSHSVDMTMHFSFTLCKLNSTGYSRSQTADRWSGNSRL